VEQLKQAQIDPKEAMTFHNGEQNKLENVTKNIKMATIQPFGNHPLEL
jgi:hypothetical protein